MNRSTDNFKRSAATSNHFKRASAHSNNFKQHQTTSNNIKLSTYTSAYQQDIIDLILGIQQGEFNIPVTIADQPDLLDIPNVYQRGNGQFWVALHDDKVVGTIALIDAGDGVGALRKMFVHRDFRGKERGIAQKLLDNLLTHAQAHPFQCLYLGTVEKLQAAIRFYERNGWKALAKSDLPPQFPVMAVDTHFFEYRL